MKICKLLLMSSMFFVALSAYAAPAVIVTDFGCGMPDGDGGSVFTTDTKVVNSNNGKGGNINFKCYFSDVPNSTGKAVHHDFESTGFLCNTTFGTTENWRGVVDSEGEAVLSCKIGPHDL